MEDDLPDDPDVLKEEVRRLRRQVMELLERLHESREGAEDVIQMQESIETGLKDMKQRREEFEDEWDL